MVGRLGGWDDGTAAGFAAVLFDVGGTLIESRPTVSEVYARTLSRWGPSIRSEDVEPVFRAAWQDMTREHPAGLDRYSHLKGGEMEWWGRLLRRVLSELGHPAPWEPVLAELFAIFARPELWRVYAEVPSVLEALQKRSFPLAVVSNWDSRLPDLLRTLGLARYFSAILVSGIEGVEKPAPEIFLRAASRLAVAPERCLHVGDSMLDDVRGAESAGMTGVLLDRTDTCNGDGTCITNLRGLHDLL